MSRPSRSPLIGPEASKVMQEVATIDGRGRFNLLPRWTQHAGWTVPKGKEFAALVVFLVEGRLSLRPLEPDAASIKSRFDAVKDSVDVDVHRLFVDRYDELLVPQDRRIHLGTAGLAHLGFPTDKRETTHTVYVATMPLRVDIMSPSYRNEKLKVGAIELDDLP